MDKGQSRRVTWAQVRSRVAKVNPEFAAIIDKLNPSNKYWMLEVKYPYGSSVMKRAELMLPNDSGDIVPITDDSIDAEIRSGLGYNLNSNPVSIVLENSFEIFLALDDRTIPLSGVIKPGTAFGAWRVLNPLTMEQPVFLWDMTAGARSVFMLPKITEEIKHKKLQKTFGIKASTPRSLMQHFEVFRELANSPQIKEKPWQAEILYFSKEWFDHLEDEQWNKFYQYFYRSGWAANEYWRNQPIWNLIFSLVLRDYEARPNGYIMDTAKYLMSMGAGTVPGLGPAHDTLAGPFDVIQRIYQDVYEIRNYPPIIMQPQLFNVHDESSRPVYYSLQFPNAIEFKPSTRVKTSIISDLHEIRSLMRRYERDLSSEKFNIDGTTLRHLFEKVTFDYFHNVIELHEGMYNTSEMETDVALRTTLDGKVYDEFPSACLFGRGCIRLSHKRSRN